MAAAAAWIRSRGMADARTTKGFLLICTLLSLFCFASSLYDKTELEEFREIYECSRKDFETSKAEYAVAVASSDLLTEYLKYMDPLTAQMKKLQKNLPEDFPAMDSIIDQTKIMLEKTKTYVDITNKESGVELDDMEEELRKMEKFINFIEELEAEL